MSFKLQVSLLAVITVVALMWTSGVADMHEQAALDAGAIVDSPAPTYRPPAPRPAERITAPTSTTTTTTTPDRGVCGEWYDLALMAGWPAADWPFLQHLIYHESRCLHDVYNPNGADNSWGLLQINTHRNSGNRQFIAALLGTDDYELLTDPAINLWVGRQMWAHAAKSGCPWRLWTTRGEGWCA
jgi:hypothetical protein